MRSHFWRRHLPTLTFLVLLLVYAARLYPSDAYRTPTNIDSLEKIYASSQYVLGWKNATVIIDDPDLYALAGWKYVHGADPTSISRGHPPIAKYLIGLSILLFGNQNVMSGIFGVLCLIVMFMLSKTVLRREWLAVIATGLVSLDNEMLSFARKSMLDIYSLFFVVASLLVFMHATRDKRAWAVFAIVFGLGSATKYPVVLVLPIAFGYLLIRRRHLIPYALLSSLASLVPFALSYAAYFSHGHSFPDFLTFQLSSVIWMSTIIKLAPGVPLFVIWSILFTGWDPYYGVGPLTVTYLDWTPIWPVITLLSVLGTALYCLRPRSSSANGDPLVAILWFWCFVAFLSQGIVFERYVINFLPAMYILAVWVIYQVACSLVLSDRFMALIKTQKPNTNRI